MKLSLNDGELRIPVEDLIPPEATKHEIELIYRIQFSHQALICNYDEFIKSYHRSQLTEIRFFGGSLMCGNNEPIIYARRDVVRTMTNVIFSAKILIEHTRNTMRKFARLGRQEITDYNNKLVKENFLQDPLSNLMEILRNYVTHVGLIPTNTSHYFQMYPHFYPKYFYNFDRNTLMQWEGLQVKEPRSKKKSSQEDGEQRKKDCAIRYLKNPDNSLEISSTLKMYLEKLNDHQNSILTMISDRISDK